MLSTVTLMLTFAIPAIPIWRFPNSHTRRRTNSLTAQTSRFPEQTPKWGGKPTVTFHSIENRYQNNKNNFPICIFPSLRFSYRKICYKNNHFMLHIQFQFPANLFSIFSFIFLANHIKIFYHFSNSAKVKMWKLNAERYFYSESICMQRVRSGIELWKSIHIFISQITILR